MPSMHFHFAMAEEALRGDKPAEALKHAEAAVSADNTYGEAWYQLGACLEKLGDYTQAHAAYVAAVERLKNAPTIRILAERRRDRLAPMLSK